MENKKLLKELLRRPIAVNPVFIRVTGRATSGILLSQIYYWFFIKNKEDGEEFYKTDSEWEEELYLSEREVRTAKRDLILLGYIQVEKKGKLNKSYYFLNCEKLYKEIVDLDGKKEKNKIYKNSKYRQNDDTKEMAINENLSSVISAEPVQSFRPYSYTISETTTENTIISNDIIEQSSDFSELGNEEKKEENKKENHEESFEFVDDSKKSSAGGEKKEFGDSEINAMLGFLAKTVGVDQFKESQKWQRIYGKHFLNFMKNQGKEEFVKRLNGVLKDSFKAKNSNSITYLFREIKAYIHSPVVATGGKREISFG